MKRLLCLQMLAAGSLLAQHSFTQVDVEDGGRLYRANCSVCHGAQGDQVPGIDLAHGKFRRAKTDDDIAAIIRSGIPGTAMPPNNFTDFAALTIVAYLRSLAAATATTTSNGDPARGKTIYEKESCAACHRIRGEGGRSGPDLSDVGIFRLAGDLERSITEPNAEILAQNRHFHGVTKDGASIDGTLLNEDKYSVQLLDSHDRLVSVRRSDLRQFAIATDKSAMPSYKDKLNHQELSDLVSYLGSLKGVEVQ